jgi:3-oxoacyl-[acyl-carrier-protein] synthase-1
MLLGIGESSDAYHMSSPHPEGRGAQAAMLQALETAGLQAADIDYINLHGTGTPSNDNAEARAVAGVLGSEVPGSSTKGATGHALGAAGALEAVICALSLQHGFMPAGLNTTVVDPTLGVNYLLENRRGNIARVMSNSFGFGGSNCTLILGARRLAVRSVRTRRYYPLHGSRHGIANTHRPAGRRTSSHRHGSQIGACDRI